MGSFYQMDTTVGSIEAAAEENLRDAIGGVEVYTQDAEFDLDDMNELG
jgi:hypothetical protein